ncbi:MAG: flagellar hook-basal body complex protein FliE [Verrucomicrobiota bacterium]
MEPVSGMLAQQLKVYQPNEQGIQNIPEIGKLSEVGESDFGRALSGAQSVTQVQKPADAVGEMVSNLVTGVDSKGKAAKTEMNRMMLGETDNIHQSMIAMQESSLAFTMLVEVRNKLVTSFQELMKMPV